MYGWWRRADDAQHFDAACRELIAEVRRDHNVIPGVAYVSIAVRIDIANPYLTRVDAYRVRRYLLDLLHRQRAHRASARSLPHRVLKHLSAVDCQTKVHEDEQDYEHYRDDKRKLDQGLPMLSSLASNREDEPPDSTSGAQPGDCVKQPREGSSIVDFDHLLKTITSTQGDDGKLFHRHRPAIQVLCFGLDTA